MGEARAFARSADGTETEQSEQQREFLQQRAKAGESTGRNVRHDHVYSTYGKCMWPGCAAKEAVATP